MDDLLFIILSVDGHLGCFQFGATVNDIAMSMVVFPLYIFFFRPHPQHTEVPRPGIKPMPQK